jgi:hypothetical protein
MKIGDGATIQMYSDRRAATIIKISPSGKTIAIQEDHAELLNRNELKINPGGFSANIQGGQKYSFKPDIYGTIRRARKRKDGKWYSQGNRIIIGERQHFYDFNF